MSGLNDKSIHELREIAQAFGVTDIFEKDAIHLIQEIELKKVEMIPPPVELPPRPVYDARLMTEEPSKIGAHNEIIELMKPFLAMGLKFRIDEESWYMASGKKEDTGSLRMPLLQIIRCAENVIR